MDKSKWTYKKLGEVCDYSSERCDLSTISVDNYVGVDNMLKDRGGKVKAATLGKVTSAIAYRENDILLGNIRPYLKKIWQSDSCGGASGDVLVLQTKDSIKETIYPRFLYYALSSDRFFDYDSEHSKGVKMPRGDKKEILKYQIPIPPISIQKNFASSIDQLSELISLKQQQLKEYDELTLSMFYDMFSNGDHNWPIKTIGKLASDVKYGTSKAGGSEGDYKYLRMNNLTDDGHLDLNDLKYIDLSDDELEKYVVRKGDVLFNRTNSREKVGKTALYWEDDEMVIAGYIIRVRLKEEVNPIYLVKYMNTPYMKRVLRKLAKGAVGQANINAQQMQSIQVPVPPLELQNLYANRIEAVEQQKSLVKQSIAETQTLLDSRMQEYFG